MICNSCKREVRSFDGVNLTEESGSRFLCSKCYNEAIAKECNLDFTHISFEPVSFLGNNQESHTFNFRTHLFGDNVSIEAFEIRDNVPHGYVFAVDGETEESISNLFNLFAKLVDRIKRSIEINHIKKGEFARYQITDKGIVRGQISWDEETNGELPLLVIDGKELSWNEFGRMLMTHEGFHFRLDIFDRFEER